MRDLCICKTNEYWTLISKNNTNLRIHDRMLHKLSDVRPLNEIIFRCVPALNLTLSGTVHKLADHIEFSPMNLVGMVWMRICIALMSPNEIRYMYFPDADSILNQRIASKNR